VYDRLLRPDRPRLAEAQKVVENLYDAKEAWEALAARGLIPKEWVSQDNRSYVLEAPDGARRGYFPPSIRMALSLACDGATAKAAEDIARRTAKDIRNPQRVVWRCVRAETVNAYRDSLTRSLRDGNIEMSPELVQTGYVQDPYHTESIMMLVPELAANVAAG
jgi:hypothetical protein